MFDAFDAFDAKEKVLFLSLLMLTALLLCLAWLGAPAHGRHDANVSTIVQPYPYLCMPNGNAHHLNPCFISGVQCVAGLRMLQSSFVREKDGFGRPKCN